MTSIPLADAKAHLSEVISRVSKHHERVTVTVHGQPSAVLLAPDDLAMLEETIAVLGDRDLMTQLATADADLAAGRVETQGDRLARSSTPRGATAPSTTRARSGHQKASDVPARGGEGVVVRYDAERGFGFIAPDAGGADLFVHVSVLRGAEALHQGDRVRYQVRQSDRGPQADRVERV